MNLPDFYPSATDLIESELTVLNHLRNDRFIKEIHNEAAQAAARYYGRNRQNQTRGFEFFSYFDIWHRPAHRNKAKGSGKPRRNPNIRLVVAALIELKAGAFQNVSYCLAVCRRRQGFPILRKFHFDVTVDSAGTSGRSQQHPMCHLQYCGKMIPEMATMGCRETQLDQIQPWLSEPRIFSWPMSLALLIDMVFHEFPDERSQKFRGSSEWKNLIRKQEALVLKPFYEKCLGVIVDRHDKKKTLADEFYVG